MERDVQIVKRAFRAFDRRDLDGIIRLTDPKIEFWSVTAEAVGRHEPYRGHDGMRRYLADVEELWEEVRAIPAEFHQRGEWIIVTGRAYARGAGRVIDSSAGWHWRLRGGLILYGRVFPSSDDALDTAPGAAPPESGEAA